ncbi:uncharacterized protein LOC127797219 isoform X2 [Diospyros lotus]|uniref:uncharacterized protein LOC127797219 isoform X2 n=1 Tax=Diospyros lotus TaxID=55363 RepID=UPI002259CA6D|nr:uncharacterized protein LOC127797219 isoform X2 [Diospyros lotus]
MAVSDIEAVLEFLRRNGLSDSESALMEDVLEKPELRSFDFEKFLFPMVPLPPPLKLPGSRRQPEEDATADVVDSGGDDSSEEFVSLGSSTTDLCSSEFTNPYGIRTTRVSSQASSDRLSQFGTARDYHEFDMQNDLYWYNEKEEDYTMPPRFDSMSSTDNVNKVHFMNYHVEENVQYERSLEKEKEGHSVYCCSVPLCECCNEGGRFLDQDSKDQSLQNLKVADVNDFKQKRSFRNDCTKEFASPNDLHVPIAEKDFLPEGNDDYEGKQGRETAVDADQLDGAADDEECSTTDELLMHDINEDEYEVFNLRIIHRKNRTGFEENKDLPIVLNSIIAGRYYVTEYLGSAAFSKVVQAHDLQTGIDVCLKIIKNDKDFFDQSLDEIKLLKFVNKHDPADDRHILRLYDYFYYQEHLFIVCELLRANLYEFQKYNQESGGEPYFTLSRLQLITRQCLEALEYLHYLGIIHCDLKPENILIKSYRRCEIKVIDLGSSCFLTDNLCLYVQSRSYRAPEVILGLPYDQRIDLWSLGCILAELCSGEVLFPNDAVVMLLARMIGMLGPIDMEMLERGQETYKYFTKDYDLYHINEDTNQLEYIIPEESSLEHHLQVADVGFFDFIRHLLEINPESRPTAKEALEHPWLSHQYEPKPC